jgi:hypothetical protein
MWVGLWVKLCKRIAAFVNLNRLILHAARFTDDNFAMLVSFVFIISALGNPFVPIGTC